MVDKKDGSVYAPVTNRNDRYDDSRIVEDGTDPIDDSVEDAIAAVKGHIEKQDWEGIARPGRNQASGPAGGIDEKWTSAECRELE